MDTTESSMKTTPLGLADSHEGVEVRGWLFVHLRNLGRTHLPGNHPFTTTMH